MGNMNTELKVIEEFWRLAQPITDDDRLCLENKIYREGGAKIFVCDGAIVDGYEEYAIAEELGLPINRINIPCDNYNEVIVWICRKQLERGDLTLMMRKYLIGRRSLAEQALERAKRDAAYGKKRLDNVITPTRIRLAKEYNYSLCAVRDYEACAKTVDMLFSIDREMAAHVLRGRTHISQNDLVAFAKLSGEQLKNKMEKRSNRKSVAKETPIVKRTPKYDPDAEISSLSLTIPSWVSLIERVQNNVTPQITDKAADDIYEKLSGLKAAADNLIVHIMEVL